MAKVTKEVVERAEKSKKWLPEVLKEEIGRNEHAGFFHCNKGEEYQIRRAKKEKHDASDIICNPERFKEFIQESVLEYIDDIAIAIAAKEDEICVYAELPNDIEGLIYRYVGSGDVEKIKAAEMEIILEPHITVNCNGIHFITVKLHE